MNLKTFKENMAKLKQDACINPTELQSTCCLICDYLGDKARDEFGNNFAPGPDLKMYWMAQKSAEDPTYLTDLVEIFNRRINAILLFEEQALAFKSYKSW